MNATAPTPAPQNNTAGRKRGLLILLLVVLVAGGGWLFYWFTTARWYATTDDAYVAGDVVQINSEVAGTILALHVDDTQAVQRGDVLAELDPADAQVSQASSEAELARSVRQVRALYAQADQLRAQIEVQRIALNRAEADARRRQSLSDDGAVSGEELAHAREATGAQRASLEAAQAQLQSLQAQIEGTTIDTHPQVLAAAASVRNAALALHRTKLLAPVSGVVARRSAQVGARVAPGAPLLAIVPLADVWVDANFKEVQLERMRVGQPVTLHSDVYGSDVVYHGKVAGLSAGSGAAFALLPAQNASGNWIKIVQRVPVRILLDPKELLPHPLRVGLSMTVSVDEHDATGNLVATQVRNAPLPAQSSDGDDPAVEARIAQIIAANAGSAHRAAHGR